jgi:hypothetical protein
MPDLDVVRCLDASLLYESVGLLEDEEFTHFKSIKQKIS